MSTDNDPRDQAEKPNDADGAKSGAEAEVGGDPEGDEDKPRKEKVLHTRVPAVLEQELKRLATSLRVPVSNVVRTILEDAVETLDTVGRVAEGELRGVADLLERRRDALLRPRPPKSDEPEPAAPSAAEPEASEAKPRGEAPLSGVVGYQPMLLARQERCSLCGRTLRAGEQAYLGMREVAGGPRVVLGEECLPFSAAGQQGEKP